MLAPPCPITSLLEDQPERLPGLKIESYHGAVLSEDLIVPRIAYLLYFAGKIDIVFSAFAAVDAHKKVIYFAVESGSTHGIGSSV